MKYKEEWVKALRSGEYEQGFGYLNKEGKLCCLGVLCEVATIGGEAIKKETRSLVDGAITYYEGCRGILAVDLMDKLGITNDQCRVLVDLNDKAGKTFKEIADYVEAKL